MNYYNDIDPVCCAWIAELIKEGLIPNGKIDNRSIADVQPGDIAGFVQAHFFCGIAGWPLALQLAGWPEDEPVWSASCPCQPFSCAGKQLGTEDERHLWPEFFRLVRSVHPPLIFGEQVASNAAIGWIDGVFGDMESEDYACAAADLCAPCAAQDQPEEAKAGAAYLRRLLDVNHPSVRGRETEVLAAAAELDGLVAGPPHIRQRLFWVANAGSQLAGRRLLGPRESAAADCVRPSDQPGGSGGCAGGLAHSNSERLNGQRVCLQSREPRQASPEASRGGGSSGLADSKDGGSETLRKNNEQRTPAIAGSSRTLRGLADSESGGLGADRSAPRDAGHADKRDSVSWSTATWHLCTDGKARRIPPQPEHLFLSLADGLPEGMDPLRLASSGFPLAPKIQHRSKVLRGYGNSIVANLASEFVKAVMESLSR